MMYADPKYAMRMTVLFFKSDSPSGIFSFIYTYIYGIKKRDIGKIMEGAIWIRHVKFHFPFSFLIRMCCLRFSMTKQSGHIVS